LLKSVHLKPLYGVEGIEMKTKILSKNFSHISGNLHCCTIVFSEAIEGEQIHFPEFDQLVSVYGYPQTQSIIEKGTDFNLKTKSIRLSGYEKVILALGVKR